MNGEGEGGIGGRKDKREKKEDGKREEMKSKRDIKGSNKRGQMKNGKKYPLTMKQETKEKGTEINKERSPI